MRCESSSVSVSRKTVNLAIVITAEGASTHGKIDTSPGEMMATSLEYVTARSLPEESARNSYSIRYFCLPIQQPLFSP